jgi:hypothetical protein
VRWVRLLFLSLGRAALYGIAELLCCYDCFVPRNDIKCCTWKKTSADSLEKTTRALGCVGWAGAKKSALWAFLSFFCFYLIGWCFSMAVFNAFTPVSLYFSVLSKYLCPANSCTIRKSVPLLKRLAITLCLILPPVRFLSF